MNTSAVSRSSVQANYEYNLSPRVPKGKINLHQHREISGSSETGGDATAARPAPVSRGGAAGPASAAGTRGAALGLGGADTVPRSPPPAARTRGQRVAAARLSRWTRLPWIAGIGTDLFGLMHS